MTQYICGERANNNPKTIYNWFYSSIKIITLLQPPSKTCTIIYQLCLAEDTGSSARQMVFHCERIQTTSYASATS